MSGRPHALQAEAQDHAWVRALAASGKMQIVHSYHTLERKL